MVVKTRRFTVDDYHRMIDAGILGKDDRVELLDGEIIEMSPIGREHASTVDRLNHLLVRLFGATHQVRVQGPVELDARSEPQPDLALLEAREDFYRTGHPTPLQTALLIEVALSSLAYDRDVKAPYYAKRKIRELWIVDLTADALLVFRDPEDDGYRSVVRLQRGALVTPLAFPATAIPVLEILGPPVR